MKNILYLLPLFFLASCFKTEKEIAQNNEIIKFVQDRARRDTVLSYNNIYLGMPEEEFKKSKYYILNQSIDDSDTIIDNDNNIHEVSVHASCSYDTEGPSVLAQIELKDYFFTAEKFNALRDLYISKYGPFSLYHTCPNETDYYFYTIDEKNFYDDLLSKGDYEIKKFQEKGAPSIEYIWCWANSHISLYHNSKKIMINYELYGKDFEGGISSVYLDYILPHKPQTISEEEKKNMKKNQSI